MVEPADPDATGTADRERMVLEQVRAVVGDLHRGSSRPTVRLDADLESELGLDSLAMVELAVRLEDACGVTLPESDLVTVATPRDLLAALERATPASARPVRSPVRPAPTAAAGAVAAPDDLPDLVAVLRWHVDQHPDRVHLRILGDDADVPDQEVTYGALWQEATEVAHGLRQRDVRPGASVALMLPTGRDYFVAFCGALLAGAVPVPVYPPGRPAQLEEHVRRQVRILDNARAEVLITVAAARSVGTLLAPLVADLRHVTTVADLQGADGGGSRSLPARGPGPGATALLQYTSGSTGDPKGVVLTHANLLANVTAIRRAGAVTPDDVFVSWLPLYHDMGLIGAWLTTLCAGIPLVVMSPLTFLARPARWLWAIHDHHGTMSGGPNFGYELCLRRVTDADLDGLDLSRWRIAFNGAEPVSPDTVTRFAARFAPAGLDPGAITPVYGLAECSVALTVPTVGRGAVIDRVARGPLARGGRAEPADPGDADAVRFVACGRPVTGHQVRIVDPNGTPLADRRQGRVQFRGPSATSGYHRQPEATERLFDGDWLDTGDLGYLVDGELYLTGRVKDLIIRAGQNLHPSELEEVVGQLDGVRKGCVAVFAAPDPTSGTERLVVLAETRATDDDTRTRVHHAIVEAAVDRIGTPPDEVVLAAPGTVPKTSSGKIRRAEARDRFLRGDLAPASRAPWRQLLRLVATSALPRMRLAAQAAAARCHGLAALVLTAVVALVVWPAVVVLPGLERRWRVVRTAGRTLLRLTATSLEIDGEEHLAADGAYVVAANHASDLDALVLALVLPPPVVFAATEQLATNPLVRVLLRRLDVHLVDQGDRRRGQADVTTLTARARAGRVVAFFPEGRRSHGPGLERFQLGAFRVAADAAVPVVPIAIRGTRAILPVSRRLPRRGHIEVTVCPPLTPSRPGWPGAVELRDATRTAILQHSGEPDLG